MKKWILLSMVLMIIPLIAQFEEPTKSEYVTTTGLVLAVDGNRINFEEMWLSAGPREARIAPPVIIVDIADEPVSLSAPCFVEITHMEAENGEIIPLKIKVLKQYKYDNEGMIKEESD